MAIGFYSAAAEALVSRWPAYSTDFREISFQALFEGLGGIENWYGLALRIDPLSEWRWRTPVSLASMSIAEASSAPSYLLRRTRLTELQSNWAPMSVVSSHLLYTVDGTHAAGFTVELTKIEIDGARKIIIEFRTDEGGRLLEVVESYLADEGSMFEMPLNLAEFLYPAGRELMAAME